MALKFGTFMAPFHCPVGQDPTYAIERDLAVIQHMDMLGFDEAWIGEHHSCGHELIPDPFIFIAYAAQETRHIKLGTGVVSLPYHNPLWIADRALFTRPPAARAVHARSGPGALPTDATMIGIPLEELRGAFEEDVEVLMAILRGEKVTAQDAALQPRRRRPSSRPTATSTSPSRRSRAPRVRGWRRRTGSSCCRSVRRRPRAGSTRWPCTGT